MKKKPAGKRARPALVRTSEEMKQWSALLGAELERWPGVRTKPMFGLVGFYRGRNIFAANDIAATWRCLENNRQEEQKTTGKPCCSRAGEDGFSTRSGKHSRFLQI